MKLTSFHVLHDGFLDGAPVGSRNILRFLVPACGAEATVGIHGTLQRVSLPAEDVVAMLAVARRVSRREHKRLRAVRRPVGGIVEGGSIPDNLGYVSMILSHGPSTTKSLYPAWYTPQHSPRA